jgi:hypothetical protein
LHPQVIAHSAHRHNTNFTKLFFHGPLGDPPGFERRQFTNSHEELSTEAQELALAIDGYKMRHRRRFINSEEMLAVIKSLGYHK